MKAWAEFALYVGVAAAIAWGCTEEQRNSIDCVRAGGQWNENGYCVQKVKP
jgi:hypothetical protein